MARATTKRSNTGGDNDKATVGLADLVIDPRRPQHMPMIKIHKAALLATMKAGQFPQPITGRRNGKGPRWRLQDVQAWVLRRAGLNPATASPYDLPAMTHGTQAKPPRKARSPRLEAPSKSGPCVTVFTASPVSTHPAESILAELVPVTLDAIETAWGRRTESEASGRSGAATQATTHTPTPTVLDTANRPGWVESHTPPFMHAPRWAHSGQPPYKASGIFYFDDSPYGRIHRTQHKTPAIRHLNGPQEAYEALAIPAYPFVRGGLVGLPGGLA